MSKFRKFIKRFFRQSKNRFEYALAFHKVSRRLGVARSRNRQYRQENEYLSGEVQRLRKAFIDLKRDPFSEDIRAVDNSVNLKAM